MTTFDAIISILGILAAGGIWYSSNAGCKHPFEALAVEKESTTTKADDDFLEHCLYLHCIRCNANLVRKCSLLNGGVNGFLERAK